MLLRVIVAALCLFATSVCAEDWRTADRSSAKLAPEPSEEPEALVQVYAARAFNWRKYFAVHCWIAVKEKNADHYTTFHVNGFRVDSGGDSVVVAKDIPDRKWYGATPDLLFTLKGSKAEQAIPEIFKMAQDYNYHHTYHVWPGPNSNTFISHIIRNVPGMGVELPPNAIGKDWIDNGDLAGLSETGTGVQVSLFGLLGFTLGLAEGVEVNVLGMTFGVDLWRPALKLPFVGRLGFPDAPVFD